VLTSQRGSGGQQSRLPPESFSPPPRRQHRSWREGSELISTCTATHYCYYCDIINFPTSRLQLLGRFIPICFSVGRWKLNPSACPGATQPSPPSSRSVAPGARAPRALGAGSRALLRPQTESLATLCDQSITVKLSFHILSF